MMPPRSAFDVRASEIDAAASARNANDESPGRNTQTPQYPAPTRSPTGIPAFPTVPSYMFKKDKPSHFDELKKNQISSTSVESPTKFQELLLLIIRHCSHLGKHNCPPPHLHCFESMSRSKETRKFYG
jgi:hypothetical protein